MTPIRSQFVLPPSVNPLAGRGEEAAFCGIKGQNFFWPTLYTTVDIFGVLDRAVQDAILSSVRTSRRRGFKPIIVSFYKEEIWIERRDPVTGGIVGYRHEADQEKRVRIAVIR